VGDELAFCNLSEPFIQAGQKLGFLRDLLEFRTRKFWQLGDNFIETHLWILAYLDPSYDAKYYIEFSDGGTEGESLRFWKQRAGKHHFWR